MIFSKYLRRSLILLLLGVFIGGCSTEQYETNPPDTIGYILKVESNKGLVAEGISSEKYGEIKDIPIEELRKQENLDLTYITYADIKQFDIGNEVEIWIDGGEVATTNPALAKAEKIELKE